ncbi:AMP-binding protein [Acrocarpospora sp. B8E8]|uniref:AMP-binding protein n=1 Tax=Acrocarpospora sp. B8E8 TaxID=3153572 RepID=UPI00325F2CA2
MKLETYAEKFRTADLSRTDDGVLTVRLHYREGPLMWTALAHREFPQLLDAVHSDEANRVVILTGTGEAFIRTPEGYGEVYRSGKVTPSGWERGIGEATRMLYGMVDLGIPVIAAVNGPVTGHSELVLLCDLVLCTGETYFQDAAHLMGGLVPGDGTQVLWPMVLGPVRARHFLLTGERLSAPEALALGVVGEVVPQARLLPRATEIARGLAAADPLVLRHTRQLLQRPIRRALDEDLLPGLGIEAYVSISRFPQFAPPKTEFPNEEDAEVQLDVERVGDLTAVAAQRWSGREYARFENLSLTFADLHRWSDAVAADLVAHGVGPGDRVMMLLVNRLEVVAVAAAAWRIGAIAVPVVAIYRKHELDDIVRDSRPAAVVTTARLGERRLAEEVDSCLADAGVTPAVRYLADSDEPVAGWSILPGLDAEPDRSVALPEPSPGEDECLRLYTSGSTSSPKGVRLNSHAVIFGGRQFHDRLGVDETHVGLALAPVTHIAGMLAAGLVPLTCGASVVILPRWEVKRAVQVIHDHRVTWSLGAAVFLKDLVEEYARRRDEGLHVLRYYVSGGANTAPELIERADALGMWAARTYGMTEAAGVVTLAPRDAPLERLAQWDGQLADNAEVKILDDMGRPIPLETEGNIWIRSAQLLLGYTDPALNRAQFDKEGWFDPGDRGMVTADRWMRITGRTKDIINRGGEKFSSADIEHVLHRHPHVEAAAVIGVPDERLGETVCAFVVGRPGYPPPTPEELAAFMIGQDMARAKVPTEWHIVDQLPRTASGKLQKHLLRAARDGADLPE